MTRALYTVTDRELLKSVAAFNAGFHGADVVLEGLTEEQVTIRPHGLPHSIADLVGHMWYWQDQFNRVVMNGFTGFPEHAPEGWPVMSPGGWDELRDRYLNSVQQTQDLAMTSDKLDEALLPDGVEIPFLGRDSKGSGLLHAAVHSAHHLGQIVTLRQLLGIWPPKAGSMTW